MRLRLRSLFRAQVLGLAITLLALLAPATVAAASQIRFGNGESEGLIPGGSCIYGSSAAGANVNLTWRNSGGALKEKTSVLSSTGGHWRYCAAVTTLVVGDSLKANDGLTQRTFTMPLVTVKVDRVANEFRGRAPANSNLTLWSHSAFSDYYQRNEVTSNAQGRWQYDDGNDVLGGTDAYLDWLGPLGDTVTAHGVGPQIDVTVGSSTFTGFVNPGLEIRLVLRDNTTDEIKAIGNAVAGEYGFVSGDFRDVAGRRVLVSVGDRVVSRKLADDLNWNVVYAEATADVPTDVVEGTCYDFGNPSQTAVVKVHRTGHIRGFSIVTLDHNGHFEVDFGGSANPFHNPANIKHGDKLIVECMLGTGDWVRHAFRVP